MRRCKTCQSSLRDEIDAMIMSGANWKYLESWCCDRGLVISETALRSHARKHIEGYEKSKTHEVKPAPQAQELETVQADPTIVDFDRYCKSIGLDLKNLDNLENNISASQRASSLNFFRLNAIADAKLRDYEIGSTKFPTEQLRALKLSYEIYSKILGVEKYIDENVAIATLESLGYIINGSDDRES